MIQKYVLLLATLLAFVTATLHAQVPQPGTPCDVTCPDSALPWTGPKMFTFNGASGCRMSILVSWRTACGKQEFSIVLIMEHIVPGISCPSPVLVREAIDWLVANNPMGFQPTDINECASNWRVSASSCWDHYYNFGGTFGAIFVHHPCSDGQCCWVDFKVCIDNQGVKTKQLLLQGATSSNVTCPDSCPNFACESLGYAFSGNGSKPALQRENSVSSHLQISTTPNPAANVLGFEYVPTWEGESQLELYDMSGRLVRRIDVLPSRDRRQRVECDVADVPDGTYVYILSAMGRPQASGMVDVRH